LTSQQRNDEKNLKNGKNVLKTQQEIIFFKFLTCLLGRK